MKNVSKAQAARRVAGIAVIAALCVTVMVVTGCSEPDEGGGGGKQLVEMVRVAGGSFQMGNPNRDVGRDNERPVHTVTLTGFSISKYPVTQEQYAAVMGSNPSLFDGTEGREPADGEVQKRRPVENVTWYDAVDFCNALSVKEGLSPYYTIDKENKDPNNSNSYDNIKWTVTPNAGANGYCLPTEAQWEYAAKGGDGSPGNYMYSGSNTAGSVAWYGDALSGKTHEVGRRVPNGLGIYDMSGNVWEWCWDWIENYSNDERTDPQGAVSGSFRMMRGGSGVSPAASTRSAYRGLGLAPHERYNDVGFRLARP